MIEAEDDYDSLYKCPSCGADLYEDEDEEAKL